MIAPDNSSTPQGPSPQVREPILPLPQSVLAGAKITFAPDFSSADKSLVENSTQVLKLIEQHLSCIRAADSEIQSRTQITKGVTQSLALRDAIIAGQYNDVFTTPDEHDPIVRAVVNDEKQLRYAIWAMLHNLINESEVLHELTRGGHNSVVSRIANMLRSSLAYEQQSESSKWTDLVETFYTLYGNGTLRGDHLSNHQFEMMNIFGHGISGHAYIKSFNIISGAIIVTALSSGLALASAGNAGQEKAMWIISAGSLLTGISGVVGTLIKDFIAGTPSEYLRRYFGAESVLEYSAANGFAPPITDIFKNTEMDDCLIRSRTILILRAMRLLGERMDYITDVVLNTRFDKASNSFPALEKIWENMKSDENVASDRQLTQLISCLHAKRCLQGIEENLKVIRQMRSIVSRSLNE